jgi:cyclase
MRLIPRIDIKDGQLVKGMQLEGLRNLGDASKFVEYYAKSGADEILYVDAVASLYGRNSLNNYIKEISKNVFIPLIVTGGIRNMQDIETVLKSGADKVGINSAAIKNPNLIKEASKEFGSSTIVVSIEAKKIKDKTYNAFIDCGRDDSGLDVSNWIDIAQNNGAGEILITSVDRDGCCNGFDKNLVEEIQEICKVPLIYCGGINSINNIKNIIQYKIDAIAIGSALHYNISQLLQKNKTFHFINTPKYLTSFNLKEVKNLLI